MKFVLTLIRYVLLAAALLFFIFPIYWLITTSFKYDVDVFSMPGKLLFFTPTLQNFVHVFQKTDIPTFAVNSLIASCSNVVLSLFIGTMAAYGISRFKVGGENLLFWFLSLRMLPPIVVSFPLFTVAAKLRLVDSQIILPFMYLLLNVPFVIWMMKSFIDELPMEIEECALIDGCSYFGTLWRIVLPM
ncbi:ABC transporter permease subunit, partial [candidate division KSB3 bacterium]|nr:ABC transporter permease subunit [candidate division KSB3 bacterium]MBD3327523.1 ABC transporter permease subunit [candidate division KSB3 bacterium]